MQARAVAGEHVPTPTHAHHPRLVDGGITRVETINRCVLRASAAKLGKANDLSAAGPAYDSLEQAERTALLDLTSMPLDFVL